MCAGPDAKVTQGGAAAARRSAVPEVPGDASPNPKDARFSPARDDARNRAAAAAAAARAPAVPPVPIPVALSPDARIAPLSRDPRRVPDAARAPPALNLDHAAARSRADPNHDPTRTVRDLKSATARRVVTSDERSPVSRVFVHSDRRRVDARLENATRACSPAAKRSRSDARLATPPSPPFDSVDPSDDDDDDTPSRKRRVGEAFPPIPASPAPVPASPTAAMDFASLLQLLDGVPASLARDHDPTIDDAADEDEMDASDLSDASFDRTDETDETDETSSPSRRRDRLAASEGRRRIVDAAIRETVRDGLDLDLPREHEHHSLSSHHRSSLSLSEPSRSSFDSDASTATNDCARASSAPFYSRKPTRPSTSSKRLSSTSSKRRPATSSKRRPATPSERRVASLETRLDSDLDARCLLARAEDEEDAADGSRSRRAKIGFARAATTSESRLPRGSTLSAHAPAFAPPTGNSVPRASCGREIRSPRFCALVPVPRERREMWTGVGGVLPAAAEVLRVLDGMRRTQDVEGVPAFA